MPVFDTDTYEVRELFSQDFVFEFPFYQRPYRWRTEHAATLLDDILAACEGPKELDELPPYFLGSIVLVRRDEDDPRVQVIDGRQRLTTLGILLAVLRDMEGVAKIKSTLHEMLFDEEDELHDIKTGPRLRTGGIDSGYLERFVINPGATTSEVDEEELPERAERIYAVAQLFRRRLSILTDEERGRIRDFVAKHCEIVGVITEDEEQGLRIFQVLNTRGLDLSEVDLIKTDLITSLPSEEQAKAVEAWDNAETLLGAQGMNKLLRVIYSVLTRTISPDDAKNFHERFVKLAKDRNLVELCTVELTDYAELLYQVSNGELPATSLDANPNEAIRALKWLGWDSEDWLPVAVEILIKAKDDSDVAYKGLRGLEVVCYSFFILKGGDRSSRDTRREIFGRVLTELSLGRDVTRPDGALSLPNITRRKMLDALNGPIVLPFQRRALLQRLEMALSNHNLHPKVDAATPEHVLPVSRPTNGGWAKFDRRTHQEHYNLLGNLALLDVVTNKTNANHSYLKKKDAIFRRSRRHFETVKDLKQHDDWTAETIRNRTQKFVGVLSEAWGLN